MAHGRPPGLGVVSDPVAGRVGRHHSEEVKNPAEHKRVGQPHQRLGQRLHAPRRYHGLQPPDPVRLDPVHNVLRGKRVKLTEIQHFAQIFAVPIPVAGLAKQLAGHDFAHHRGGESLHSAQRDLGGRRVANRRPVNGPVRAQR